MLKYYLTKEFVEDYNLTEKTVAKNFSHNQLKPMYCSKDEFLSVRYNFCFVVTSIYVPTDIDKAEIRLEKCGDTRDKCYQWTVDIGYSSEPSLEDILKESKRLPYKNDTTIKDVLWEKNTPEFLSIDGYLHKKIMLLHPYTPQNVDVFIKFNRSCRIFLLLQDGCTNPSKEVFVSYTIDNKSVVVVKRSDQYKLLQVDVYYT